MPHDNMVCTVHMVPILAVDIGDDVCMYVREL